MSRQLGFWVVLCCMLLPGLAAAETDTADTEREEKSREHIEQLDKPLYNPFVERYVLDDLKQLRIDMANQRVQLTQQMLDREHSAIDRAVSYSTNTVTYFFYLIAGATSVLVLVGWSSLREIKERVHTVADDEISKLVAEYEERLRSIESQLNLKTRHIEENREEIELTREIQALWLRAQQDNGPSSKIVIYDQILKLHPDDVEALTYKADAVLELNEPQWAANLCHQALVIDPNNGHAFYQLACAYAALNQKEEAVRFLQSALQVSDSYRVEMITDPALDKLRDFEAFRQLIG
ncbi:TPR end-of-group domain-containing protein [Ketobacter alkanivorans]|nr:tetratricopeptide repeat protein [Ketobacter alkanivorans]MCP5015515.1 tetratricopeptide repeat protein [Ketobacter sp.]